MLKAQIQIDDELAVKGFRRAFRLKAVKDTAYFYAWRLAIVWIVISIADALAGESELINWHLLFVLGLWVVSIIHGYADWKKRISDSKGWIFEAILDESGVKTSHLSQENIYAWSFYRSYQEFDDYLEIEDMNGGISFLPKVPELFSVIEFTKNKIPKK